MHRFASFLVAAVVQTIAATSHAQSPHELPPGTPPPAPPGSPPALSSPEPPRRDDDEKPGWNLDAEAFGGRFSTLGTGGSDGDRRTYGGSFGTYGLSSYQGRLLTSRTVGQGVLGGGGGGFEGQLYGTLALGIGGLFEDRHGPFVRVGVSGYILGNDSFFHSAISFPQGSAGWHAGSREGFLVEIGGTLGPMLDGRFNVGDQGRRRLGSSAAYGAYLDVFAKPLSLTFEWQRIDAVSRPGTAVDTVSGHACLATGKDKKQYGLALCIDGRHESGDVHYGVPPTFAGADTTYLGLTVGLGFNSIREPR